MLNKLLEVLGLRKVVESGQVPPRRMPAPPSHGTLKISGDQTECLKCGDAWDTNDPFPPPCNMEPPVRHDECQADERCGFPLHIPEGAGPTYPPHHAVKITADGAGIECLDCGEKWVTHLHDVPPTCIPRDPMKYMYDAGFTDFPFKKPKTEVTSDKPHPMESLARNLFEQARCFKTDGRTHYEINPMVAYQAVLTAITWLGETPFVSSGHAAVDELEQLIAAHLPGASHSTFLTTSFAEVLIRWCERHPLN